MSKICADCGEKNTNENKFCQKCGSENLINKKWTMKDVFTLIYVVISLLIIFKITEPFMEDHSKIYAKYIILAPAIIAWVLISIGLHYIYEEFIKKSIIKLLSRQCTSCQRENRIDLQYCIYCGEKIKGGEKIKEENIQFEVVRLVAYVAKADGVISKNEAQMISEILSTIAQENGVFYNNREELKKIFNEAKSDSSQNFKKLAHNIFNRAQPSYHIKLIRWLAMLVYADGSRNIIQANAVNDIAEAFKLSKSYMNKLYEELDPFFGREKKSNSDNSSNSNNNSSSSTQDNRNPMEKWFKILQCKQTFTDQEIKKAYRNLVKQYHPDAIQGKELPKEFIELANQRLKEINLAYETIKKYRGMR